VRPHAPVMASPRRPADPRDHGPPRAAVGVGAHQPLVRRAAAAAPATPADPPPLPAGRPAGSAEAIARLINATEGPVGRALLEIPLLWFVLPQRLLGGDYVLVPLNIGDRGPYNFLVDTGLTTNLLTPQLCKELDLVPEDRGVKGLAGDGNVQVKTLALRGVYVDGRLEVPRFTAAVLDFPQRGYAAERGVAVHGMVGMEFLEQFDVRYARDPTTGGDTLTLYRPHEGYELHESDPKWTPVRGILLPSRLMGVKVAADNAPFPFLGIVDTGASHTIMNREAARLLGYDLTDPELANGPGVNGVGVLGQPTHMPTVPLRLCISGFDNSTRLQYDWAGRWWLDPMEHSKECAGFEFEATAAIGDMNFDSLTALTVRGLGPFYGPLVLTGQDFLTQRELVISGAGKRMLFGAPTGRYNSD